ncbi:hypothetical protein [Cardinium endosymbiont of Tipula unca]|uniref:hypothetical protein n=1 Tax=Cardinium endosymbiont of Tipula unca TaxID=3066216 RepID=UPI0030D1C9E2
MIAMPVLIKAMFNSLSSLKMGLMIGAFFLYVEFKHVVIETISIRVVEATILTKIWMLKVRK